MTSFAIIDVYRLRNLKSWHNPLNIHCVGDFPENPRHCILQNKFRRYCARCCCWELVQFDWGNYCPPPNLPKPTILIDSCSDLHKVNQLIHYQSALNQKKSVKERFTYYTPRPSLYLLTYSATFFKCIERIIVLRHSKKHLNECRNERNNEWLSERKTDKSRVTNNWQTDWHLTDNVCDLTCPMISRAAGPKGQRRMKCYGADYDAVERRAKRPISTIWMLGHRWVTELISGPTIDEQILKSF